MSLNEDNIINVIQTKDVLVQTKQCDKELNLM